MPDLGGENNTPNLKSQAQECVFAVSGRTPGCGEGGWPGARKSSAPPERRKQSDFHPGLWPSWAGPSQERPPLPPASDQGHLPHDQS